MSEVQKAILKAARQVISTKTMEIGVLTVEYGNLASDINGYHILCDSENEKKSRTRLNKIVQNQSKLISDIITVAQNPIKAGEMT